MKKNLKKILIVTIMALSICGGVVAAYATKCILVCPECGSMNTNHYHPNGGQAAQVKCRDCGHKWCDENPPQEPSKEENNMINNN